MITNASHTPDNYENTFDESEISVPVKRLSWGAIFAGVIISMVVYLLLTILGAALGASTVDPLKEQNPIDGLGTGAVIWAGISMLISIAIGGYISGRLAHRDGALHGFMMFGINTLFCTWLLVLIVNNAMSGAISIFSSGLQTLGNGITAAAPPITRMLKDQLDGNNINLDSLQNELETVLMQTGKTELQPENLRNNTKEEIENMKSQARETKNHPQTTDTDIANFIQGLITRNEATFQAVDRDALKNIIKSRTGKSDQEAEQIVRQAEITYQQARAKYEEFKLHAEQKARETEEKAAAATAKACWFTFFMLLVEAVLAGAMGMLGHRTQSGRGIAHRRPL